MSKKPKDPNKRKKRIKILLIILGILVAFVITAFTATNIGNKINTKKAQSFEQVKKDDTPVLQADEDGNWTFTCDRDFKILHLTDIHIGAGFMSLKKDAMALNAVAAMVSAEKPDLVVVTGDIAYPVPFQAGTFNNKAAAKLFAALMEQLGVYWTVAFGNHDSEVYSYYSREEIADFYENSGFEHCIFKSGPEDVDGYCNQLINIKNSKGEITQSLYIFDSHSYTDGDHLGILWKYDNIHENQIEWYKENVLAVNAKNDEFYKKEGIKKKSDVKSLAFFHIPLVEQRDAWYEYANNGYKDTENVQLIYGVAGASGKVVYCGVYDNNLFETMQELGSTKGVFVGHDHKNNFSLLYKGIRLTYGMSIDYIAFPGMSKIGAQRGCTVIEVSPDGTFDCHAENYYQDKYVSLYEKEEVEMQEVTYAETKYEQRTS